MRALRPGRRPPPTGSRAGAPAPFFVSLTTARVRSLRPRYSDRGLSPLSARPANHSCADAGSRSWPPNWAGWGAVGVLGVLGWAGRGGPSGLRGLRAGRQTAAAAARRASSVTVDVRRHPAGGAGPPGTAAPARQSPHVCAAEVLAPLQALAHKVPLGQAHGVADHHLWEGGRGGVARSGPAQAQPQGGRLALAGLAAPGAPRTRRARLPTPAPPRRAEHGGQPRARLPQLTAPRMLSIASSSAAAVSGRRCATRSCGKGPAARGC